MNLRRQKLAERIALQGAAAIPQGNHTYRRNAQSYTVREPGSRAGLHASAAADKLGI